MKKSKKKNLHVVQQDNLARQEHQNCKSLSYHDLKAIKPLTTPQRQMMESYFSGSSIFASGSAGTGKAQPLDSLVRTPSGWIEIGKIEVGDEIVCPDGTTTTVNGVFPQGKKETYSFVFEDGRIVDCCTEHLWLIENYKWETSRVMEAKEIKEKFDTLSPRYFSSFRIPLIQHENIPDASLPLDPYILGIIIGDGCLSSEQFTFSSADTEIIEYIENYLTEDYKLRKHEKNCYDYTVSKVTRNSHVPNKYVEILRDLGLSGKKSFEKFIPDLYKNSSKQQKHELLRGLIDSDGEADKNGSLYYHTTSEQLKNDVVDLVQSLGGIAYVKEKHPHYIHNGEKRQGRKSFRIRIRYRESECLSKLDRKLVNMKESNQYKNCGIKIKDILESGEKECVCISVDHPDHLYITDGYITTHNTLIALYLALNDLLDRDQPIDNIKIVRSVVPTREVGYLPGDLSEKISVYETPYREQFSFLFDMPTSYDKFKEGGKVEFMPTSFLRGQTWDNSVIVVDEVQNLNFHEVNTVMTRVGRDSKIILVGDSNQSDLFKSNRDVSCIEHLDQVLSHNKFFDTVYFQKQDIVRSDFVRAWIECIED